MNVALSDAMDSEARVKISFSVTPLLLLNRIAMGDTRVNRNQPL